MQALMNEASDLAAANLELKEAHQKEMEAQQLKFAQESSQLTRKPAQQVGGGGEDGCGGNL